LKTFQGEAHDRFAKKKTKAKSKKGQCSKRGNIAEKVSIDMLWVMSWDDDGFAAGFLR
jgi:hypothetical protein